MIAYDAVSFAYPTDDGGDPVLRDVSLEIRDGEFLLVTGPSGSGKSTLLRAANGLVPHASGGRFRGTVAVFGRSTRDAHPRDLANVVGFVHQDPEAQFVVDHVEGDVAFVLENLAFEHKAMRRHVEEALDALDIAHLRNRSPATLSGGERQRCAIAGAMVAGPRALVLDEPTSQLDPQGAEDVLGAITRLNTDLGTTIVVAEHRLDRAAPLADRAAHMVEGRLLAVGSPGDVLASYDGAPAVTRLGKVLGWDPLPLTVKEARSRPLPDLAPPSDSNATAAVGAAGDELLRAEALAIDIAGRRVLDRADIDVRQGEIVAVLGRNGAGKTTLLRTLAGLHVATTGSLRVRGRAAYVPQDPNTLLFAPTVRRELQHTLQLLGRHDDDGAVSRWLVTLGLEAVALRHPRSLSGGERQRVAIAAVAVGGAEVLLLDEPTRGMDASSRSALQHAMEEHARGGGAVVLATHDIELVARCATRAIVLGDGDIVATGGARDVLAGSLFAPQVSRVLPRFLTVEEVASAVRHAERRP